MLPALGGKRPFPGNEARSDDELLSSPAIWCVRKTIRQGGTPCDPRVILMGDQSVRLWGNGEDGAGTPYRFDI